MLQARGPSPPDTQRYKGFWDECGPSVPKKPESGSQVSCAAPGPSTPGWITGLSFSLVRPRGRPVTSEQPPFLSTEHCVLNSRESEGERRLCLRIVSK